MGELQKLDAQQQRILCDLADPEAMAPSPGTLERFDPDQLFALSEYHGIDPVVTRKVCPLVDGLPASWTKPCNEALEHLRIATVVTMALEAEAAQIKAKLDAEGIPCRIVKGAAFAADLYPDVADRPFTDVDVVLHPDALAAAGSHLRALGFEPADPTRAQSEEKYREQKWVRPGIRHLLIELHSDLVHQPSLRRRVRYGYDELMAPGAEKSDLLSEHVLTAVVHGAMGHKFHNLKLAVDVLQAFRRLPHEKIDATVSRAKRLHVKAELAASAKLVCCLFPGAVDLEAVKVFEKLSMLPMPIDRDAVTNAFRRDYFASRARRHVFRWTQNLRVT
ncbi:MAG: nucleotidyltransferase family protein [Pseudomonadota bacterium]